MFGVLRVLSSLRSRAIYEQSVVDKGRLRSLISLPDISHSSFFSFFLSSSLNRTETIRRFSSGHTNDENQQKEKTTSSTNADEVTKELKQKAGFNDEWENVSEEAKAESKQSTGVTNEDRIRELTNILQGFTWKQTPKEFQKKPEEQQESLSSITQFIRNPFKVVERLYNWFYGGMIHNYMDNDFDILEFLEGAKDAYYMVNQLFGEGDFETLKPMVSSKLLENFKAVNDDFVSKGLIMSISTEDIKGVNISGLKVVNANSLTIYGPEFETPLMSEGKKNFWFLVYVRFSCIHRFRVSRPGGSVVNDSLSFRRDLWTFVRGPINVLPIKDSSPGWTLLTIA